MKCQNMGTNGASPRASLLGNCIMGGWGAQRKRGHPPFAALPGSCPMCWVKAAARPHTHKKWHEACSRTKDLNTVKVVEHPLTTYWDLQGESCHQAWADEKIQGEPWILSWLFLLRKVLLGAGSGGVVTVQPPWQKRHCFSNKIFHKWSSF